MSLYCCFRFGLLECWCCVLSVQPAGPRFSPHLKVSKHSCCVALSCHTNRSEFSLIERCFATSILSASLTIYPMSGYTLWNVVAGSTVPHSCNSKLLSPILAVICYVIFVQLKAAWGSFSWSVFEWISRVSSPVYMYYNTCCQTNICDLYWIFPIYNNNIWQ